MCALSMRYRDIKGVNPSFRAFITNLGKYNEGQLVGKWHDFPTTKEKIMQTFREIGIDGINYEEFFITDYEVDVKGIYDSLSEYASIDEINYFVSKIHEMNNFELEIFESAVALGSYSGSLKNFINLTENLDCFDYIEGVNNDYDLGYYWINESGCYDTDSMGKLAEYFDYESFGRDISIDENGAYTGTGYVRNNGTSFYEEYDGVNIPDEYKVFAMPKEKPLVKVLKRL